MPRLLVVNDDGVDSPGIIALAEALRALGEVTVVAPDGDRSGASHSITARHIVKAVERVGRSVRTFACSGTPADCVVLGVNELCGGVPDVVVSGINRGANLADDINYSGTVAAAVEAAVAGVGAIAVSLAATWPKIDREHHWDTACGVVVPLAEAMLREPLPPGIYWNVNVPNVAPGALHGVRYTRQGRKQYVDRIARGVADGGDGATFSWVWGNPRHGEGEDTDAACVAAGYASVSPLRIDRTDEAVLERYRDAQLPLLGDR